MTKNQLLTCAGNPAWKAIARNYEFFGYQGDGGTMTLPESYCKSTFTLKDGRISKIVYQDHSGTILPDNGACTYVIQRCLSH